MAKHHTTNTLRIIGGRWRGRRLVFPDAAGLRPTPDRVRETLFNWLAPLIEGARCLDLYAGSGALGLEALSRGAAQVSFVDSERRVIAALRAHLDTLQASTQAQLIQADATGFLRAGAHAPFDIVFLDPPYRQGLVAPCCALLEAGGWLAPQACIYIESEASLTGLALPPGWQLTRSKRAGQVAYHLARRTLAIDPENS